MKREIKITIKDDLNHYALLEQINNKDNEINRGLFLDKDQYTQLGKHFNNLPTLSELIDLYQEETGYGMDMWSKEENNTFTTITKILYGK
jgi:hypothetical protein